MADRGALPPGPRLPGPIQTHLYTFDQPTFFARCRERFGSTWSLRLPGFPPTVFTNDRDAIKRLLTGDPLTRRHGNDLLRRVLGDRSLLVLEPREHLARRRIEPPPFHGEAVRSYGAPAAAGHSRAVPPGSLRRGARQPRLGKCKRRAKRPTSSR